MATAPMEQEVPRPAPEAVGDGRRRVYIQHPSPAVDDGRYPAKRIVGDRVRVTVDLVADGHDVLGGVVRYRHRDADAWEETPLREEVNDRWEGVFEVSRLGGWEYTVEAWVDDFATWRRALQKKTAAGQDVGVELLIGAELVERAVGRARGTDAEALRRAAGHLRDHALPMEKRVHAALDPGLLRRMSAHPDRSHMTRLGRSLPIVVERPKARFSAWYEFFPRSTGEGGAHGTFRTAQRMLPYIAELGFDVVYLPPIHPIGRTHRKGRNNTLGAGADQPGSPWAIGGEAGGHKSVHPDLGTLEDFRRFVKKAETHGLEVALDIALQASPDHPYVREHPEWFRRRPDGTIQYAENPPKKYQDIYPFDFDCDEWRALWQELLSIFLFWAEQGVRVFRVDNPHTKSIRFWAWCVAELRERYPAVILLAEAFTRPKLMYQLAKVGFTQGYTYFTWRNTAQEFEEYLTDLTRTEVADFFRPNFWPNTPDILPEHLQYGGRAAFQARAVLAATLSSSWGIYGPVFELQEHVARPGAEEYVDNEKYELRDWDLDAPHSLRHVIARLNRVRKENAALHRNDTLVFHRTDNDQLLCYSKSDPEEDNVVLCVVSMDPHHRQTGHLELDLEALGVTGSATFQVHDLMTDARFHWSGSRSYVEIDPHAFPAHVFRVRKRIRTEEEFDYYG